MTPADESAGADRAAIILVVDDEVLVRMVIAEYLRHCGYRVIEAANGEEALLVLQQSDIAVEIVLSAVQTPGATNGFGLSQWTRQHRPDVDVILVGSAQQAANTAADLCEIGPALKKPYEAQLVVDRIRQLLAERSRRQK